MKRAAPCSPFHADPPPARSGDAIRLEGAAKQALEVGRSRLLVASLLFAVAFLIIAGRLVSVALLTEGREPRLAGTPTPAALETERADIVDRNGVILATNLATASLYANARELTDPATTAATLARVLPDVDAAELVAKLSADRSFVWVKRNLTPRQHYAVNRLGIPGLYFQREERRVYPHGPLAAHVLGFTDIDNRGIAGVEQHFDRRLKDDHQPLALSIDIRMQHVLREELARAVAEFSALGGGGVILDATSGEILAMVSLPDFDPNAPGVASPEARFNRNTLGVYEMGSVFKIFTTAMALDSGVTSLSGGYDASRPIRVSRYTITDYHPKKRWLSVPEIFMYSSNIGSARMALDVGPERQRDFLGRLGMLKPLALELPELGEPQGPSAWKDLATMTIAFGHGLSVTPMHMAAGVSAIVNGGRLIPTTLTRRDPRQPVAGVQVIRPDTSEAMRRLMRLAVERGTGKNADVPGYRVGGKTGTAEKVAGRRYKHNALFSSFVAAFPIEKPRFVLFIALDEPQATKATHGFATGGWIAAPVAARVIERVAPIAGVAPIEDETFDETDGLLVAVTAKGGD